MSLSSLTWALELSWHVSGDADFLCNKAAMLCVTINDGPCRDAIISWPPWQDVPTLSWSYHSSRPRHAVVSQDGSVVTDFSTAVPWSSRVQQSVTMKGLWSFEVLGATHPTLSHRRRLRQQQRCFENLKSHHIMICQTGWQSVPSYAHNSLVVEYFLNFLWTQFSLWGKWGRIWVWPPSSILC
jgi:hypothetical protein